MDKTALFKMRKSDSVLRESMRKDPASAGKKKNTHLDTSLLAFFIAAR